MADREQIRQQYRQARLQQSAQQQVSAADAICRHLAASFAFKRARHIAFYLAHAGEVDLSALINYAWQCNKIVYLPVLGLRFTGQLWFARYYPDSRLYKNRFGIGEPEHSFADRRIKLRQLDIIFMPLVAYDQYGHRLGMGGGFYDKTLAIYARQTIHWRRPRRIGIAYAMQQVANIPSEAWDISLDSIATEQGLHHF